MLYDLSSPLDVQSAKTRFEYLVKRGCIVEITEKKPKRTLSQNSYLHLLLGYFASQTGNTLDYVKWNYYKIACNPDIFIRKRKDEYIGEVEYLRSSASLTTEEMSLSIDRFRNWSSATAGIFLPDATNEAALAEMQIEVERYKTYLY